MDQTPQQDRTRADTVRAAVSKHPRRYEANRYVYPVLSRRSRGISIGINLNPDKVCNFACIYCQVDRTIPPVYREVDLDILERELRQLLTWVEDGTLFLRPPFTNIPDHLKRVNDIAFSGDGEPTSYPQFPEVAEATARIRDEFGLEDVKLVVITNCSLFHRPRIKRALAFLDRHNGEIWAKLDAGTPAYYHLIDRTRIPFERIVRNIVDAATVRPLVIQSLFMRVHDEPPAQSEIAAYCRILNNVLAAGGRLKLIQLYTVARRPAEPYVTSLSDAEMDALGEQVRKAVAAPVEVYYGVNT